MNARKVASLINVLIVVTILVSACASAATPAPQAARQEAAAQPQQPPTAPQEAPAAPAADASAANTSASGAAAGAAKDNSIGVQASPYQQGRLIIKNGEMTLVVLDTDRALDQATSVATDTGGYIVASKTWLQDGFKYAEMTMGVPVDQFEVAQRRLRGLAVQVLNDTASGQDVSDEFVDLQSRLNNQEATAARIREFLKDAKTVEEALKVNAQLTEVENEIEQIKGRMNYLKDRSAFSTLVVTLNPQIPTPTPTMTPTPTPTPTPAYWQPGKTVEAAGDTLGGLLRGLIDAVIWLGIVLLPFAIPVLVLIAIVVYFNRRRKKPAAKPASTLAPVAAPAPEPTPAPKPDESK
jgi:predicted lipid-binding transport protein (Tim44 family)